jgi:hypothetical protein
MFTTKKTKNAILIAEDDTNYIYFNPDGKENTYESKSKISLIPNPTARDCRYICGASGTGKSTLASDIMKKHSIIFPKNTIYIFSRKDKDEAFDKVKNVHRIKIDKKLVEEPIDILNDIEENDLCLFDDIDSITDKELKEINRIIMDILEVGRAKRLYCIITSHLINGNDKKRTRVIMNECQWVSFSPKINLRGNTYFLLEYMGLSKEKTEYILNHKERFVHIHRFYPNILVSEKKIECL